jgi:hypothetical protein
MSTTIFLAQLWGPVILAVGVGVFVSRNYYIKIYRDLEKDALAVLLFGMIAMTAGITHILAHNIWDTFPQIVISFLGWGLLIKGVLLIVVPKFVDRAGDTWVNFKLIPFAGGIMLLVGVYLSWIGYFA